jgi:hypothetical protein
MYLGNDFGTLQTFEKTLRTGYEDVLTWRNLKQRLTAAKISGDVGFYTNAVLGLRTEKKATDNLDWSRHPDFCHFCGDLLRLQLDAMRPRLLVILGQKPKDTVGSTIGTEKSSNSLVEESRPQFDGGRGDDSGGGVAGQAACGSCHLASLLGFC